ncbi:GH39 family glycosyl hydrolase [Ferruginibacter albus]|uniref:GH39 family glycosyl hydrolase n=1 Tax=Ferruginibacter albus TaxID=2875540 RepID=UPI001CC68785|nr:glycosyl hydrolase [Ferruginibacter albus]UAY52855.1 glycoside hydrolase [Ferruginibacter albus]
MPDFFSCDLTGHSLPFPHFWEHTIGSGHATLALRADWQRQLLRCHNELGFKHVRFHGILSDDMGTLMCEMDKLVYSFFNADQIFDFLLSIGMKPFVELSFMPSTLASGPETVFHYKGNITPPRNYIAWEELIRKIVQHWVDRYGTENVAEWFFEIWNEPNLSAFWKGTQQDYFLLYEHAAKAIKGINKNLKVGGPATAGNAWVKDFRNFCEKEKLTFDFISTHHYPTDAFGQPGDDTVTQLADSRRSVLREQVIKTRKEAGSTSVYYTEWSTSSNPFDELHDLPYAAAFITKTIMEARNLVQGYSYWTFSDIFEENFFSSAPFHGGFGLLNIYGIPKPAYRAYQLLNSLGTEIISVNGSHTTVDVWVIRKGNISHVLITNSALPRHPVKTESIKIHINIPKLQKAFIERIDDKHANAKAKWIEMGSPASLSPLQVQTLELASSLIKEPLSFSLENNVVLLAVEMPPQGTALITLETA